MILLIPINLTKIELFYMLALIKKIGKNITILISITLFRVPFTLILVLTLIIKDYHHWKIYAIVALLYLFWFQITPVSLILLCFLKSSWSFWVVFQSMILYSYFQFLINLNRTLRNNLYSDIKLLFYLYFCFEIISIPLSYFNCLKVV